MNETDRKNMKNLKESLDRLLFKLESQPPVTCSLCGVEWNKLYEGGVCIDCDFLEKKRQADDARKREQKNTGFQKVVDDLEIVERYQP